MNEEVRRGQKVRHNAHGIITTCSDKGVKTKVLVVVEDEGIKNRVAECLDDVPRGDYLQTVFCESVEQCLKSGSSIAVDFVVFFLNPSRLNSLTQIEQSMMKLSKSFLLDRICLICDSCLAGSSMKPDIIALKTTYHMHVLWGNIKDQCPELCQRLFNLVTASCGTFTGFPFISIKNNQTMFSASYSDSSSG